MKTDSVAPIKDYPVNDDLADKILIWLVLLKFKI